MFDLKLLILPFIAAFIGWLTNYIAVKMLFHPRRPVNILGIKIQGVFPKRQKKLAIKLGSIVSKELFSIEDIKHKILEKSSSEASIAKLEEHIDFFLKEKLPAAMPMLSMFLNADLLKLIREILLEELKVVIQVIVEQLASELEHAVNIHEIVQKRVESFSSAKLETILFSIMSKEFRFIEIVGAILGFLIGVIQIVLLIVLQG